MTAPAILETLHAAGLNLSLTADSGVKVAPASRLTDELRQVIRAHKNELADWLAAANDLDPDRWCWPRSDAMNTAEIERFTARLVIFMRRGLSAADADALADKLVIRDREGDDRRACPECVHFRRGRCGNYRTAGLDSPELGTDLATQLQRCPGFKDGGAS